MAALLIAACAVPDFDGGMPSRQKTPAAVYPSYQLAMLSRPIPHRSFQQQVRSAADSPTRSLCR